MQATVQAKQLQQAGSPTVPAVPSAGSTATNPAAPAAPPQAQLSALPAGDSPLQHWALRPQVDASSYLRPDGKWLPDYNGLQDLELPHAANRQAREQIHHKLRAYMRSSGYAARVAAAAAAGTGIVIPAGGSRLVTNLIITLQVLREHHKSRMPVEVMWQGRGEMDRASWQALRRRFHPIEGVDITRVQHPTLKLHRRGLKLTRYVGKVFSLLASSFRHVLMIDADCMPVMRPDLLLATPQYLLTGNLFWPDCWTGALGPNAYEMHGVTQEAEELIQQGKGRNPRDTESGQLLFDRSMHLDVLEYLLWVNSFEEDHTGAAHMWGDKDTFGVAFAVAGKAHVFTQVDIPPAGLFSWRKDMLMYKDTKELDWGWQLFGFLQFDASGHPAFIHRTINKFTLEDRPWPVELISAPMPSRWVEYYLSQESLGPTKGVPYDYVVPASAITLLTPTLTAAGSDLWGALTSTDQGLDASPLVQGVSGSPQRAGGQACPVPTFLSLWAMKESGLAIDLDPGLRQNCSGVLRRLLGPEMFNMYRSKGWLELPMMRYMDKEHMSIEEEEGWEIQPGASAPLPAWRPDFNNHAFDGPFAQTVKAAYKAYDWLDSNKHTFPILLGKPTVQTPAAGASPSPSANP